MNYKIPESVPVFNLQKIVADMIAQAVEDYKAFVARGQIVGRVVKKENFHRFQKNGDMKTAREVIHFFTHGILDEWISVSGIDIAPDKIRSAIGLG